MTFYLNISEPVEFDINPDSGSSDPYHENPDSGSSDPYHENPDFGSSDPYHEKTDQARAKHLLRKKSLELDWLMDPQPTNSKTTFIPPAGEMDPINPSTRTPAIVVPFLLGIVEIFELRAVRYQL